MLATQFSLNGSSFRGGVSVYQRERAYALGVAGTVPDLDDPALGRLTWHAEHRSWISTVELSPGHRIEVFVDFDPDVDTHEEVVARARGWLDRVRQREREFRRWSAEQFLSKRWNTDEPMTVEGIDRLLRLCTLECSSDGTARLYWEDEDVLFYGHGVITELDQAGECAEIGMQ